MARALRLACRGLNTTTPNPRVGCVLVKDGRILGEGWHERAGEAHAEIRALQNCKEDPAGSTCYVTLEPCSHTGRTPPCSEALIGAGVTAVIAAMPDPNPAVAGSGLQQLESAGIRAAAGLLAEQARLLNAGFIKRMQSGLPHVRLKLAASLDGRTAVASGESRWISGEQARADVQRLRARSCAILTGIGTVLADDPRLTARPGGKSASRQPLRVIMDTRLRLPATAQVLRQAGRTLVVTGPNPDSQQQRLLEQAGAGIVALPDAETGARLEMMLRHLATEYGVNEVMVEAGAKLNGSLLRAGLVDELTVYMTPQLLGHAGLPLFELAGVDTMQQRLSLEFVESRQVGRDLRLTYRPMTHDQNGKD